MYLASAWGALAGAFVVRPGGRVHLAQVWLFVLQCCSRKMLFSDAAGYSVCHIYIYIYIYIYITKNYPSVTPTRMWGVE